MIDTQRKAFDAWWSTMNEAPDYPGKSELVAWNAWQAAHQYSDECRVAISLAFDALNLNVFYAGQRNLGTLAKTAMAMKALKKVMQ